MQKEPIPAKDMDGYLAAFPEAARQKLKALRKVIRQMFPGAIAKFRNELGGYMTKVAVQLPLERPLPLDLIARIIRYRVEAVG